VLQCVAVCRSTGDASKTAKHSIHLRITCQSVAACCSVLQCVAACCSVLQCVAVQGSALQRVAVSDASKTAKQSIFENHFAE